MQNMKLDLGLIWLNSNFELPDIALFNPVSLWNIIQSQRKSKAEGDILVLQSYAKLNYTQS